MIPDDGPPVRPMSNQVRELSRETLMRAVRATDVGAPAGSTSELSSHHTRRRFHAKARSTAVAAVGIAAAVTAALVFAPGADEAGGEVVALGADGLVVTSTSSEAEEDCVALQRSPLTLDEAVERGVVYALDISAGLDLVNRAANTGSGRYTCENLASIASSYLRVEGDDETVTAALTLWGPDATEPLAEGRPESGGDVVELGVSSTGTYDTYGGMEIYEGTSSLSWTDDSGSWTITASGLERAELVRAAAAFIEVGSDGVTEAQLPGMTRMGQSTDVPDTGDSWSAQYGPSPDQGTCVAQDDCTHAEAADQPDHADLTVDETAIRWAADLSRRSLSSTFNGQPVEHRLVEVDGQPALFRTAGEGLSQVEVLWQTESGALVRMRGTIDGSIDGVIALANQISRIDHPEDGRLVVTGPPRGDSNPTSTASGP